MTPQTSVGDQMDDSPHERYTHRLASAQADVDRLSRRDALISNGRLTVFALIVVVIWAALGTRWFSAWFALAPAAAFVWLLVHDHGLARLEDRWMGRGQQGRRYEEALRHGQALPAPLPRGLGISPKGGERGATVAEPTSEDSAHLYARDIDLFGEGSLYELLCVARTRAGADCLAEWLTGPAGVETIRERQDAVKELAPLVDFRERILLLGDDISGAMTVDAFSAWGEMAPAAGAVAGPKRAPWLPAAAGLFGALNVAACVYGVLTRNGIPLAGTVLLSAIFARVFGPAVSRAANALRKRIKDLTLLAGLLRAIEAEPLTSPRLAALKAAMNPAGEPASAIIAALERLLDLYEAPANAIFGPIAALLLWRFQVGWAIESWRRRFGFRLRQWALAAGEVEALISLAGFSDEAAASSENGLATYPELVEEGPRFEAEGLAHPLLPRATRVGNDLALDIRRPLLIVSGSNMSGKSTLMRTIGCNLAIAQCGAPVIARRLILSPLILGASIRTEDSLQGGISRFYAEILRIRQIVDAAGGDPALLFLLDEILHGTNSHDRLVGAEAILRTLVKAGAIGLVSTHDLALARLAHDTALGAVNVHFEDSIVDGRMVFDYRLRNGVVTRSNAIELMRSVGLDL